MSRKVAVPIPSAAPRGRGSGRYLFTGGPGAGKTTVLEALAKRGFRYTPDSARQVIQDRLRLRLPPRPDPVEFAREILRRDVEGYDVARRVEPPVFFDRGLPDALGMLHHLGDMPIAQVDRWLTEYPFEPVVFAFPPWREIYTTDSERDHTFEHAERVFDEACQWYNRLGFSLIVTQPGPVSDRCEFVLSTVRSAGYRYSGP